MKTYRIKHYGLSVEKNLLLLEKKREYCAAAMLQRMPAVSTFNFKQFFKHAARYYAAHYFLLKLIY